MKRILAVAVSALLASSCASTSDVEKLQDRIADLQQELAQMKRTAAGKDEVQSVNQKIADQTETLLRSNTTLVAKVDQIEDTVQNVQGSVEQTGNRLDRLTQQVTQAQRDIELLRAQVSSAAASASPGTPAGGGSMSEVNVDAPAVPTGNPLEIYTAAFRDYQKGNFDLAIEGFRDFLAGNANSELADNASYWIGESLFSQKKYREAIQQFDTVVNKFPRSDKVPGSLLKKGYAYISLNEKAQGIVQLQYVLHEHPKSQEAGLARQKLKQLGVETK
jgi:tol-pal system protein YbgF